MGISLGVVVEDDPYSPWDNGANWRDILFCGVAMAAAKATTGAYSFALIIVLTNKWAGITDSGSAPFYVGQTRRYCVL